MSFSQLFLREKSGNPIGDGSAIMPFKTDSGSVYWFNTHYSPPEKMLPDKNCRTRNVSWRNRHRKTTFEATASGFLQRFDPLMFVVGLQPFYRTFVRAYGGAISHCRKVSIPAAIPWQLAEGPESPVWHRPSRISETLDTGSGTRQPGQPCSDEHGIELNAAVESIMQNACRRTPDSPSSI